jgi:hypothetical protein
MMKGDECEEDNKVFGINVFIGELCIMCINED